MSVSFGGFNENTATFKSTEEITKGTAVKMSESNTVTACTDGDIFCGIACDCDGSYASVQLSGAVTVKYSGTAPKTGYEYLVSGNGGVKVDGSGREYLVVAINEAASTVTFIM